MSGACRCYGKGHEFRSRRVRQGAAAVLKNGRPQPANDRKFDNPHLDPDKHLTEPGTITSHGCVRAGGPKH
jgi:hypothetical protein